MDCAENTREQNSMKLEEIQERIVKLHATVRSNSSHVLIEKDMAVIFEALEQSDISDEEKESAKQELKKIIEYNNKH